MVSSGMNLATCLAAGLCIFTRTGSSTWAPLSQEALGELANELKEAGVDYGIDPEENELLDLLLDGAEHDEEVGSGPPPQWEMGGGPRIRRINEIKSKVPIKSIQEIKSISSIESLEEIKTMTPIKSLQEIKSIKEVKSIIPVPEDIAKEFIAEHGLVSNEGETTKEEMGRRRKNRNGRRRKNRNLDYPEGETAWTNTEPDPEEDGFSDAMLLIQEGADMIQEGLQKIHRKSDPRFEIPDDKTSVGKFIENPKREGENIPDDIKAMIPGDIKSIEKIKSMEPIKSIQEIKKITEVKSIQPIKSIQEVKSMYELTEEQADMLRKMNAEQSGENEPAEEKISWRKRGSRRRRF